MHAELEPVSDAEPYIIPEAEPVAEPYVDPGAEPDAAICITGVTTVGVCGLLASPVEGWGGCRTVPGQYNMAVLTMCH
jgi:hypothetical protein